MKIEEVLKKEGIKQLTFLGKVSKTILLKRPKFDIKALDMIKYTTTAMWGWPQGAGSHWQGSVFTNDFSFRTNGNHVDVYKKGNFFYRLQNIVQSDVDFSDSLVFPNQNTILSLKSNMTLFMKY